MKLLAVALGLITVLLIVANVVVLVNYQRYLMVNRPNQSRHRTSAFGVAVSFWLAFLGYLQFKAHPELTLGVAIVVLLANIRHTYELKTADIAHDIAYKKKTGYRKQINRTDKDYSVGDIPWLYIHKYPPPRGQKIHILQSGGISIQGNWRDDSHYMAWQHLHCRDQEQEKELAAWLYAKRFQEHEANVAKRQKGPHEQERTTGSSSTTGAAESTRATSVTTNRAACG